MSVVAPAVYVGTWHKYNCGSIAGRWFDLTTFDDERDFFAACRALHQDETDPELMFQDYEGFPGNMASECHINWAWVEGFRLARDEGCEEAYRLWVEDTGETDFDTQLPSAVCVRLRLPLRPCIPALSPGFYGGTAPPGVAEHVTMEDSGMSVVAPAVYVGTWHKYNCGSIAGRWFDLTTFDDERDFFAACRALHQDEADPELMFQDYEGFPGNMASECHINWAWVEGFRQARDEGCEEAYRLWVDDTGETDFDSFRDAWWGEADSEEAFAVEFVSDAGLLADVPETVALYFDYEAYARDLFLDSFTFIDGHVFRR
ncbi:Antirestriction protein [Shigella sonnei]|nr:Antirestriction protein [Shigella sonnei]